MGGLFGGLLGLITIVGGGILSVLIGKVAWKRSDSAQLTRVAVDGLVTGYGLGLASYLLYFAHQDYSRWGAGDKYTGPFLVIPFFWMVLVAVLEALRRNIDRE